MSEQLAIQPLFEPQKPGKSLDLIDGVFPATKLVMDGYVIGERASELIGHGGEKEGLREYVPGDNPRYIDFKTSARRTDGSLLVRKHYKDVVPDAYFVTDILKDSYRYNAGHFSEQQLGLSALVSLASLADAQRMSIGLLAATNNATTELEPEDTVDQKAVLALTLAKKVSEKSCADQDKTVKLPSLLRRAARICTGSVVVIISDFRDGASIDGEPSWLKPLQDLDIGGNEIIAVELTNLWDYKLPEYLSRLDTGNGVMLVPRGKRGRQARAEYAEKAAAQQERISKAFDTVGIRPITLSTEEPRWAVSLRQQLKA